MENTSEYIKESRSTLGLTQKQLAEKIGTKRVNIAKYETGRSVPPGNLILEIEKLLKESI